MGNICRSPTAEEVLRTFAAQETLPVYFDSAGTENYHVGDSPDPRAIHHARQRGYDLSHLRARQVRAEDFGSFDLIMAADALNLQTLRKFCPPDLRHKTCLFLEDRDLPDPYYGGPGDFEAVLDLVEKRSRFLIREWHGTTE